MSSDFERGSLPCGSLFGIPIRLSYTLPLMLVAGVIAEAWGGWQGICWALICYGPLLLGTVLVHELGHALMARRAGGACEGILLWPLGGLAYIGHEHGPKADLKIALAGPLTHIPMFLIWFAIYIPVFGATYGNYSIDLAIPAPSQHFGLALLAAAVQLNLGLLAFNLLLPAFPLDGGRIFADLLLMAGVAPRTAAQVTAVLATLLGLGVVALGVWRTWVASVASVLTIFVGLWMLYVTLLLWESIRAGTVEQHPLFRPAQHLQQEAGGGGPGAGGASGTQLPVVGGGSGYRRYDGDSSI